VACLASAGCTVGWPERSEPLGIERAQRLSHSLQACDVQMIAQSHSALAVAQAREDGTLDAQEPLSTRVRLIAGRLAVATQAWSGAVDARPADLAAAPDDAATPATPSAPEQPASAVCEPFGQAWPVEVLGSSQLELRGIPGGGLVVYTGLVTAVDLTDDELAAAISHEMAHVLLGHARERVLEQASSMQQVKAFEAAVRAGEANRMEAIGALYRTTLEQPYSRLHEIEADRIGVELAARAGFDPRAAITLWEKVAAQAKRSETPGATFERLHPSLPTRSRDLQMYAARVQPFFEQARSEP
jgi:Zn-dependent protease with chaperone function